MPGLGILGAHLPQQVGVVLHQLAVLLLQLAVPLLVGLRPPCHARRDTQVSTRDPPLPPPRGSPPPRAGCWLSRAHFRSPSGSSAPSRCPPAASSAPPAPRAGTRSRPAPAASGAAARPALPPARWRGPAAAPLPVRSAGTAGEQLPAPFGGCWHQPMPAGTVQRPPRGEHPAEPQMQRGAALRMLGSGVSLDTRPGRDAAPPQHTWGHPRTGRDGRARDAEAIVDRAGQTDRVTALPTRGRSQHPTSPVPSVSRRVSSCPWAATRALTV